jgi:hypothetical protein
MHDVLELNRHAARIRHGIAEDPAQAIGSAKQLLETVLKTVIGDKDEFPGRGSENAQRMQALVLLLRYGRMRIGDTVSLSADRIEASRLLLYTQKTSRRSIVATLTASGILSP